MRHLIPIPSDRGFDGVFGGGHRWLLFPACVRLTAVLQLDMEYAQTRDRQPVSLEEENREVQVNEKY